MNPFLGRGPQSGASNPPAKIYGRIDRTFAANGHRAIRLDGLDADWLRNEQTDVLATGAQRLRGLERMPVFFLELSRSVLADLLHQSGDQFDDDAWYEIDLAIGIGASLFHSLYAESTAVRVVSARIAKPDTGTLLDDVCDLGEWTAGDDEITAFFDRMPRPNVETMILPAIGNGRVVGLAGKDQYPICYADFGDGIVSGRNAIDGNSPDLCLCATPIILLSDWHHSRWSYASVQPHALAMYWIAPLQKISPSQIVFATSIMLEGGKLRVASATVGTRFTFGNLEISVQPSLHGILAGNAFSITFTSHAANKIVVLPFDEGTPVNPQVSHQLSRAHTKTCPYCGSSESVSLACRSDN